MQNRMNKLSRKLRQKLQNKQRSQGGFTLVELIVVLVIMGLLTAALVPTVTGYVGDAEKKIAASDKKMIEQAAMLYLADWEVSDATGAPTITVAQLVEKGYLSAASKIAYTIEYSEVENSTGRYKVKVKEPSASDDESANEGTT